ncbi:hypothetical protein GCM10011320_60810 [Neoroseomonas lacus]|uniref:DUF2272 domain-containing protein n=1 Tax=Neoroseomonas lacus TaxID=287609 RepID=A0A917L859_9PROT|nr:hypothetical protein GCM10011320_60810 [Neoroseomonas lacus]
MLPFLVILALAACAPRRVAPLPDPNPTNPLARAAVEEWRIWGRIVIEGWPEQRPPDTAATPGRFARLTGYWSSVPGGWRIAQQHEDLRSGIAALEARLAAEAGEENEARPMPQASIDDLAFYADPAWSAAFISAVARLANMPESDLPSTSRHARYIDAILDRAMNDPEDAPFTPHAPEDQAPVPGDLLCADRAWVRLSHWVERLAERGRPRPMHCDVVVRTMPGMIEAIGGNVQGTVALRRFPADRTGRVLPAPYDRPGFILLLAARRPPPS